MKFEVVRASHLVPSVPTLRTLQMDEDDDDKEDDDDDKEGEDDDDGDEVFRMLGRHTLCQVYPRCRHFLPQRYYKCSPCNIRTFKQWTKHCYLR